MADLLTKTNDGRTFKYVSIFSGIGGFEQALNGLGGLCVMASEIDKYAEQAYQALYGHATVGDIQKVNAEDVPDHDVLVGGFPCQSFSVAGKRGGFEDARGTLFFDIARIAAEKQPKVILAENVKGLISHDKGKTMDTIVKALNEIGYRVDFNVLNSKFFGVPQNRERVFIVAIREDLVENEPWSDTKGSKIVPKGKRRISGYDDVKTFNYDWPEQDEVTTKLVDILEESVDEHFYLPDEKTAALVAKMPAEDKADAPNVVHNIYGGFKETKPRVFKDVSPTIRTSAGGGHLPSLLEETGLPIREATSKGYAIAQEGDAVNFRFPNSKTRRGRVGKQIANTLEASGISQGAVVNDRGNARENADGISNAVDANYFKGLDNHAQRTHVLESPRYRIRKLSPLECFRLQGFSDEAHQALVDAGISNTQRYKQAGNAVTVNVIEALGERLLRYL